MTSKAEKDRQKQIQDKCQQLLNQMLRDEDNKYCVDCDAKGPRWASWNLGVFLCIRCAGIHRNLGVHISRVKSVNLDTWTPEQVVSLQQMGNSRARAVYEANLPDTFRRPQTDSPLEAFVRAKYEHKKYIAREWVPPPLPKVNWDKELEEEADQQRRRRKDQKSSTPQAARAATSSPLITSDIPAPLPKPKSSASPKVSGASNVLPTETQSSSHSNSDTLDLLGLDTPSGSSSSKGNDDIFSGFLSAPPATVKSDQAESGKVDAQANNDGKRSKEEDSFFNQPAPSTQEKRQLTKDSILALYSSMPSTTPQPPQPIQTQSQPFPGMQGGVFGSGPNIFPQAPVGVPQVGMNIGLANGVVPQPMPAMPTAPNGMFGAMPTGVAPVPAMMSNPFYNMQPTYTNQLPTPNMLPVQNQDLGNRNDLLDVTLSTPQLVNQLPQQMGRLNMGSGAAFSSLPSQPTIPIQNGPQGMSVNPWGSVPSGGLGQTPFPVQGQAPMGHTLATNLWQ